MPKADIQELRKAAENAQTIAAETRAAYLADPADPVKKKAFETAEIKATETWEAYEGAVDTMLDATPNDWRVILLASYLAIVLIASVYALSLLAMAVPADQAVGALRVLCCGPKDEFCKKPAATPIPIPEQRNSTAAVADSPATTSTATPIDSPSPSPEVSPTAAADVDAETNTDEPPQSTTTATPSPTPEAETAPPPVQQIQIPAVVCVRWYGRASADGYLFLIVLMSGIVGSITRLVFSFVRHQGIRDFSMSWVWYYLFTPLSGSVVSLLMYFVIRGGFYGSPVGTSLTLNVFAFIALGALSGLFAENAMLKLKEVAQVIFAESPNKHGVKKADKKKKP